MIAPDHLEAQAAAAREKARKLRRARPPAAQAWETVAHNSEHLAWCIRNAQRLEREDK
jgi:hypothetical protein